MSRDISINSMANEIMSRYDKNRSGEIEYKKGGTFFDKSEGTINQTNTYTTEDSINVSTTKSSREKLFFAADANGDGKVTRQELVNTIKQFDKNGDSNLTQTGVMDWMKSKFGSAKKAENEFAAFDKQYGETSYTNTVSIPTNNKPVYPNLPPSNGGGYNSNDPFSNNKPGSVTSDPFSKPSNGSSNKPGSVTSDPFSKPSNGSSNKPGSVTSDPFSKPSNGSSNKPSTSDPFSSGSSNKPSSSTSDPFKK